MDKDSTSDINCENVSFMSRRNSSMNQSTNNKKYTERKRNDLTVEKKLKIIDDFTKGTQINTILKKYGINQSHLSSIIRRKSAILQDFQTYGRKNRKRIAKRTKYAPINEEVYRWLMSLNCHVSGSIIQNKAKSFAEKLNITGFRASNGWLECFRKKYNVHSYRDFNGSYVNQQNISNKSNSNNTTQTNESISNSSYIQPNQFPTTSSITNPRTVNDENTNYNRLIPSKSNESLVSSANSKSSQHDNGYNNVSSLPSIVATNKPIEAHVAFQNHYQNTPQSIHSTIINNNLYSNNSNNKKIFSNGQNGYDNENKLVLNNYDSNFTYNNLIQNSNDHNKIANECSTSLSSYHPASTTTNRSSYRQTNNELNLHPQYDPNMNIFVKNGQDTYNSNTNNSNNYYGPHFTTDQNGYTSNLLPTHNTLDNTMPMMTRYFDTNTFGYPFSQKVPNINNFPPSAIPQHINYVPNDFNGGNTLNNAQIASHTIHNGYHNPLVDNSWNGMPEHGGGFINNPVNVANRSTYCYYPKSSTEDNKYNLYSQDKTNRKIAPFHTNQSQNFY